MLRKIEPEQFLQLEVLAWRTAAACLLLLVSLAAYADEWRQVDRTDPLGRPAGTMWTLDEQAVSLGHVRNGCFVLIVSLPELADFRRDSRMLLAVDDGKRLDGVPWQIGRNPRTALTELCYRQRFGGVRLGNGHELRLAFPLLGGGYHTVTLQVQELPMP